MEDALVRQNLGYALFKRIVRLNCASKDLYLTNFMYLLASAKILIFMEGRKTFMLKFRLSTLNVDKLEM